MKWYWVVLIAVGVIIISFALNRIAIKAQLRKQAALGYKKLKEKEEEITSELESSGGTRLSSSRIKTLTTERDAIRKILDTNNIYVWAGIMTAEQQCASVGKCWNGYDCIRCSTSSAA